MRMIEWIVDRAMNAVVYMVALCAYIWGIVTGSYEKYDDDVCRRAVARHIGQGD